MEKLKPFVTPGSLVDKIMKAQKKEKVHEHSFKRSDKKYVKVSCECGESHYIEEG